MAYVNFDVDIGVAPPPPRAEMVPAPLPGYYWAPEHWEHRGEKWHFERGYWEREGHRH
jgi:hypothetical protein